MRLTVKPHAQAGCTIARHVGDLQADTMSLHWSATHVAGRLGSSSWLLATSSGFCVSQMPVCW